MTPFMISLTASSLLILTTSSSIPNPSSLKITSFRFAKSSFAAGRMASLPMQRSANSTLLLLSTWGMWFLPSGCRWILPKLAPLQPGQFPPLLEMFSPFWALQTSIAASSVTLQRYQNHSHLLRERILPSFGPLNVQKPSTTSSLTLLQLPSLLITILIELPLWRLMLLIIQ